MNKRIKTLAKVAGYDEINKAAMKLIGFDLEKFAELIVKECVEVCHKMAEDSDSYVVHDGDTCAEQIKKHFGVEE
jgi:hypothetical protein